MVTGSIIVAVMFRAKASRAFYYRSLCSMLSAREKAAFERAVVDKIGQLIEPVSRRSLNSIGAIRVLT